MSILLLHLDHSHGPAPVPQMCRSPKMCGSQSHHQMQIPGFQSCKTQESSRAAVFYIQCHLTIAIHIKVWALPVHLEHWEQGRETGRGGLMLMGKSLWRIVCPPSSFSLHHDELGNALFTGKSSYCPCYLILTFSICTMGDCAILSSLAILRFFDSKTCYQATPYDLPSTLINYPSQVQAEVTLQFQRKKTDVRTV